ncbi:MAG TPA: O-antigen ligase family protein [Patescibacteria group bacterium]|nr:O-antigen ligase family protein [Patescibacteria group bacterium]
MSQAYFLLFLIIFIIQGLGFPITFSLLTVIFLAIPCTMLIFYLKNKDIPERLRTLFILFIGVSFVSLLASVNLKSLIFYLLYIASFSAYIFTQRNQKLVSKFIVPFIFIATFIFILASILIENGILSAPLTGYQFVFSRFGSHNHLGDFLLLPLITLLYFLTSKKKSISLITSQFLPYLLTINYLLLTLILLPFFILSYSRSAYIGLVLTIIIMLYNFYKSKIQKINLNIIFALFIVFISIIFTFSLSINSGSEQFLKDINHYLVANNSLHYKSPYGGRGEYVRESILSTIDHPLLGVGPGNFIVASKEYESIRGIWTETAHNIFLDILVENGIPAGVIFILIIFEMLRGAKKNLYFYLALAMLFNFQVDYTYRIFPMLILFFVLLALANNRIMIKE